MTDRSTLVPDARGFFARLAANNSRDWFAAHKAEYEAAVKHPAEALLDEVAAGLEMRTGHAFTPKLYRIHRDLRFSKDKTPYNTHLHLQWSDRASGICFLFGVSAEYVTAGLGAMAFPDLDRWRASASGPDGAALAEELARLTAEGHRLDAPALKRVPAPYPADHGQADLLRRKGLVCWHDLAPAEQADLPASLTASFDRFESFRTRLAPMLA